MQSERNLTMTVRHRWPPLCALLWALSCTLAAFGVSAPVAVPQSAGAGCVRVVEDRALGLRWLVEAQPGGRPNRMVPIAVDEPVPVCAAMHGPVPRLARAMAQSVNALAALRTHPATVIQVGQPIVVVQSGSAIQARFPAVAMTAAAVGESFPARLAVGTGGFGKLAGRVVRATAVAGGLARWDGETEQAGAEW